MWGERSPNPRAIDDLGVSGTQEYAVAQLAIRDNFRLTVVFTRFLLRCRGVPPHELVAGERERCFTGKRSHKGIARSAFNAALNRAVTSSGKLLP
jgi:hypothetical protein